MEVSLEVLACVMLAGLAQQSRSIPFCGFAHQRTVALAIEPRNGSWMRPPVP